MDIHGCDISESIATVPIPTTFKKSDEETWDIRSSISVKAIMLIAAIITIYQFFKYELLAKIRREKR